MKNFVLAMVLCVVAAGCVSGNYVEIGTGYNDSFFAKSEAHEWDNAGAGPLGTTIEVGHEWELSDQVSSKCRYLHVSQLPVGPPFNNNSESSLDHIGCSLKFQVQ